MEEDVPQLPAEAIEDAPASSERLMEIVIRVCDQYGFPRKQETSSPDQATPKRE
jgi:hypothetical protein